MADGQWPLLLDGRVCDLGGVWKCGHTRKSATLRISLPSLSSKPSSPLPAFELLALIVPTALMARLAGQISGRGTVRLGWPRGWTLISRKIRKLELELYSGYILFNEKKVDEIIIIITLLD